MKTKKELKDELQSVEEMILSGQPMVKSFSEYTYLIGKRDTLVDVLKPRKRDKKNNDDGGNKSLQKDFGIHNPISKSK